MRLSLGAVTLRATDTGLRCKNSLKNIPICAQFLFPGQDGIARARGLQHDGLSSDRYTRDRALGRGGRDAGRGQDRGWHLAFGLDRGGGVRPLDRLHIALVRPPGYFLVTARISIARRATYAIPTASDFCCARLDGGGRRAERTEEAADHHQSAADRAGLRRSRQVAGLERRVEPEDQRPRPAGAQQSAAVE